MKKKTTPKTKTRDQYTVVLEDVRSQLKGVAEGVTIANEKMDREFKKVHDDMRLMRTEISLIRHHQVTRDEFKALENRVFTLEKKVSK